jgi:diguanylate cyclase (GGDEF)-like protein
MELETVNDLALLLTAHGIRPLLSYTRTMIALVRPDGVLLERNPAFAEFEQRAPAPVALQDLLLAASRPLFDQALRTAFSANEARRDTLELVAGNEHRVCDCLIVPLPDGNFLFLAETPERPGTKPHSDQVAKLTRDLQETRRALHVKQTGLEAVLAQVDEIAHTDQLTFLSNQRKIVGDLQRMVTSTQRSRRPLAIFMLDIDRFKPINDTYGHIVGDQVLRKLAGELRDGIRRSDRIGRCGGEEFLILLPATPLDAAIQMAERLLNQARNLVVEADGRAVRLTVSIGIAQYARSETWKEFLARADKAMYQSKNGGRDRWSVANSEDGKQVD